MPRFDMFTDQQRRHLAHIYASLRECIADEVEYDRTPDFAPLDDATRWAVWELISTEITALMRAAHAEEAAAIEAQSAAWWAAQVSLSTTGADTARSDA